MENLHSKRSHIVISTPEAKSEEEGEIRKIAKTSEDLDSRFGILILNIPINYILIDQEIKEKYSCRTIFLPKYQEMHRSTLALFYSDSNTRDQKFDSIGRIGAINVEKLKIDPHSETSSSITNTFLTHLKNFSLKSSVAITLKHERQWTEIRENSKETFAKIIEDIIEAYNSFDIELRPSDANLYFLLIFEFFMLIHYKAINSEKAFEFISVINFFKLPDFEKKFFSLNPLNQDYIFETMFQCMFYDLERDDSSAIAFCERVLDKNRVPISLTEVQGLETIKTILKKPRVKSLFQICPSPISYEEIIEKVLPNVYLVPFPPGTHGKTLFNLNINIASESPFPGEKESNLGFIIIVLLHELGHYFIRNSFNSAKKVIDHQSPGDTFTKKRAQTERVETRREVEEVLLGERLEFVTNRSTRWISETENWDLENFAETFTSENHNPVDIYNKAVKKHRIMQSESGDGSSIDFSHNWCGTSRKKLLRMSLIEENKGR